MEIFINLRKGAFLNVFVSFSTKVLHANLQGIPSLLHLHWDALPIVQIDFV